MNAIIFIGSFAIGLAISLFFVEREWRTTSRDIGRLINVIREQADTIDKLGKSATDLSNTAKDILKTDDELIKLCENLLNALPTEDRK